MLLFKGAGIRHKEDGHLGIVEEVDETTQTPGTRAEVLYRDWETGDLYWGDVDKFERTSSCECGNQFGLCHPEA